MSVDYETGVVRTTSTPHTKDHRPVGAGEQAEQAERGGVVGGVRPESGEVTRRSSGNRNSHTLTEKDVEIGFQEMEKHNGECSTSLVNLHSSSTTTVLLQ